MTKEMANRQLIRPSGQKYTNAGRTETLH